MNRVELIQSIKKKKSFLCVGLDTDILKIPSHIQDLEYPLFEFNKTIIDHTSSYTVCYKPNLAFYESMGTKGWQQLKMTAEYIRNNHPDTLLIADAKRGDIGNTSKLYARAFFKEMDFDAITIAPYMGEDSVRPFLDYENKWVVILSLTSNKGAFDFQYIKGEDDKNLFEKVLETSQQWGSIENTMFVVGATKAEMLTQIRTIVPDHFLLVPGVGAQGGSLEDVVKYGMNKDCGLLVNSSRGIIFADNTDKFGEIAGDKAKELQQEMAIYLKQKNVI